MFYLQKENEEWSLEKTLLNKTQEFDFKVTTVVRGFLREKIPLQELYRNPTETLQEP